MSSTSLVIASYNQPNALALVLEGVLAQTEPVDEIVFADDGSQPDTLELVERFRERTDIPVHFTTQEDEGFRKAKALNNAIRASHGEWVLFLDGDCIPPREWAARYTAKLRRGAAFATAGYVWMDLERARELTPQRIAAGVLAAAATEDERRAFRKVHFKEQLYRVLRKSRKPRILGGNWAATRAALDAVNGFDENFDHLGKEDSDIRNRLSNAGFRGVSLWDCNWVFHCSHDLDPRRTLPGVIRKKGVDGYYRTRLSAKRCENGLVSSEPE